MTVAMQQGVALAAIVGLVSVALFQLVLASGTSAGKAAWGGSQASLSPAMRISSAMAAALLVAAAFIVLGRAGYWAPHWWSGLFHWGIWALVPLLALSALANFASKSRWEKAILGPLALLLSMLCLIVALGPGRAM
jgi:hypothetical protein